MSVMVRPVSGSSGISLKTSAMTGRATCATDWLDVRSSCGGARAGKQAVLERLVQGALALRGRTRARACERVMTPQRNASPDACKQRSRQLPPSQP
eukprot:365403-Chlamydomonas_euryale.AAC.1